MVSKCGELYHSDAAVRTTLDDAALRWGRTMETEVLGEYDLIDEEKYTGRMAVPTTRQQQLLDKRGSRPAPEGEAALWNLCWCNALDPAQHAGEGTLCEGRLHYLQHTSQDWQPAMALLA